MAHGGVKIKGKKGKLDHMPHSKGWQFKSIQDNQVSFTLAARRGKLMFLQKIVQSREKKATTRSVAIHLNFDNKIHYIFQM